MLVVTDASSVLRKKVKKRKKRKCASSLGKLCILTVFVIKFLIIFEL